MKKLLLPVTTLLFFGFYVTQVSGQPAARVVFPEMQTRTDSVSFYVGLVSGFDIASDLETIDPEIVIAGMFAGFVSDEEAFPDLINQYQEYAGAYLTSEKMQQAREMMVRAEGTKPQYLKRRIALPVDESEDLSGQEVIYYGKAALPSRLLQAGEPVGFDVPVMGDMLDSLYYARGIIEGNYITEWIEEVEFYYFAEGMAAGYLIGSENYDDSQMRQYLIKAIYPELDDYDYYGTYGSGWREGIELPESIIVPEMKSEMDSVSFFFGVYLSQMFQDEGVEFSLDMLFKGLVEGQYAGDDMPVSDIDGFLSHFFEERLPEARMEKAMREVKAELDSIAALPGIIRSESGLLYRIIEQGDMDLRVEDRSETIELEYVIRDSDGNIYESSEEEGESCQLGYTMEGFAEGVELIGRGGTIRMYINPELAEMEYSYRRNGKATVYQADVTLLETAASREAKILAEAQGILDSLSALPGIRRTESGLLYKIVAQGDMDYAVEDMSQEAELIYTVNFLDGRTYSESGPQGTVPSLGDMMKGFYEGVTMIGKGGHILLYIPPGLTDDADGYRRDFGSTVFEADIKVVETWKSREQLEREEARSTLDSLTAIPGMRTTDSGLIYEILEPGDPDYRITSIHDRSSLIYSINYLGGEVYDDSGEGAYTPSLGDMMEGFYEGATMIGKGGRIRLYIPPGLTNDADGYKRGWGSTIFEAEIKVVDAPAVSDND